MKKHTLVCGNDVGKRHGINNSDIVATDFLFISKIKRQLFVFLLLNGALIKISLIPFSGSQNRYRLLCSLDMFAEMISNIKKLTGTYRLVDSQLDINY